MPKVGFSEARHSRGVVMDPDAYVFRRAALGIGLRVAALCSGMVGAGAALFFAYLWWRAAAGSGREPNEHTLVVSLDPGDLAAAGLFLGVAAIILAGVASMWFARRAVAPLAESMRRQRTFVNDASHELRAPLTVLSARIQQLALAARPHEELMPMVTSLSNDAQAMSDVVTDLLQAASTMARESKPSQLGEALAQVESEMRFLAEARGINLSMDSPSVLVAIPQVSLQRCLTVLIDNAIGHTPEGGHVQVKCHLDSRWVFIAVIDNGTGICGISPDRVFERFARGARPSVEDGHAHGSHGLGLALAHDIITSCGGKISVAETSDDGTTFHLQLPRVGGS